ncbi:Sensor protein FixL [Martelella mediterranea DSM 17316]|uniref:histidine kinase n=2 Tax=Martelella mediterranea TaxID=293089 RepID=A0A1U9Z3H5_9HYPH|nr:Sensor protein FixL [Martelella mediterranea DSM 17316]
MASPMSGSRARIDIENLVQKTLQEFRSELDASGINTCCELSNGMKVAADEKQIEHAIANLISVAIEAMKDVQTMRMLHISCERDDRNYVLRLSNTGAEIPLDSRDAIFDPHYSSKEGNRGIKLAIARTIAQLHGGGLDVARSDGNGTTMLLILPAIPVE